MSDKRYQVNHNGEIVADDSALCGNQSKVLQDLFSQFGWSCHEESKEGSCHHIELSHPGCKRRTVNVYSGSIRDEKRSPYEKKIQLGTSSDPRDKSKEDTIILGIYVYDKNDSYKDAIFVGYPIDDKIKYDTNPSIRGTFVDKLLVRAKTEGFVYDAEHNTVGFRPEFIFYYLDNHYGIHYTGDIIPKIDNNEENLNIREDCRVENGINKLYYGVPGAGKSYKIDDDIVKEHSERVVFHPDYTYSDFVGQIVPRLVKSEGEAEEKLRYVFEAGPFTRILKRAIQDPNNMYYLVIEEINRGNAPAIFGDIFQLLDRENNGSGKYSVSNYDMAKFVYGEGNEEKQIRMPSNLTILATMNTSDQNIFTLDTAFQRRWEMHLIKNDVTKGTYANKYIEGCAISWGEFAEVTNEEILELSNEVGISGDKRLGAYFAKVNELSRENFPEKVLKYLWDDAFKMEPHEYFADDIVSVDEIIDVFDDLSSKEDPLKKVLKPQIYEKMRTQTINKEGDYTSEKDEKLSDDALKGKEGEANDE